MDPSQYKVLDWRTSWLPAVRPTSPAADSAVDSESESAPAATPSAELLLVCNDCVTAFRVPRCSAVAQCKLIDAIEASYDPRAEPECAIGPDSVADPLERDGVVPLVELPEATPDCVGLLALWLQRRATVPASVLEVPTPGLCSLEELFDDPWDHEYLTTQVSTVHAVTENLDDFPRLRRLMALSVAVGADALRELLAAFCVFQLRRAVRQSPDPLAVVRVWLKYPVDRPLDVESAETWAAAALEGLAPERVERPFDADQWMKTHLG
jgi:hypothetical protein